MVGAETLEFMAQSMCFISLIAFIFIATFSRSEKLELFAQNFIMFSLLITAGLLGVTLEMAIMGFELPSKPLSLLCIIVAVAARMNIKGQNVSLEQIIASKERGLNINLL